jgi:hypothetical protein
MDACHQHQAHGTGSLGVSENGQYTPETAFLVGKMVIRQYGFWMILGFP